MTALISLIYASDASGEFREHQIPELLKAIRPANAKRGVTGMLLFNQTSFLQVLEGEATAVQSLFEHIARDARHTGVTRIVRETIGARSFSDWYMDYATVDALDVPELADETVPGSFTALNPLAAKRLLARLRRPSWQKSGSLPQKRESLG